MYIYIYTHNIEYTFKINMLACSNKIESTKNFIFSKTIIYETKLNTRYCFPIQSYFFTCRVYL